MKNIDFDGYRFPPAIIQQAIWLYFRFTLSYRDVEDLLAERWIAVSNETVLRWVNHFGPMIAAHLRKRCPKPRSIDKMARLLTCATEERSVAARFRLPRRFSTGRVAFARAMA